MKFSCNMGGIGMEFFEVLRRRRSIRRFERRPVEREKLEKILEAAFLSPSSYNRRAWIFIVVDDPQLLDKLAESKAGAQGIRNAPLAIVVAVDEEIDDVWIEDGAIAAEHIQLAAFALGLSSFWVQIRKREHKRGVSAEEFVKELLRIPENYRVLCIVAVGYPAERKSPHGMDVMEWEKVRHNLFSQKF